VAYDGETYLIEETSSHSFITGHAVFSQTSSITLFNLNNSFSFQIAACCLYICPSRIIVLAVCVFALFPSVLLNDVLCFCFAVDN